MREILLVDSLGPKGHINFTKELIELLDENKICFISEENFIKNIGNDKIEKISIKFKNKKYRINFYLNQLKILKKVKQKIKEKIPDKIIFTSFDNFSMLIFGRLLKGDIYLFVHNNLELRSSKVLMRLLSKQINLIVFEEYIKEELKNIKTIQVINHPIYLDKIIKNKMEKNRIFAPSGGNIQGAVDYLISEIKMKKNFILITKGENKNTENIIYKKYFEDYYEELGKAEFIYLPIKFNLRVSGVFYEAMTFGKKIFTYKNFCGMFLKKLKKEYPNSIYLIENMSELNEINYKKEEHLKEIEKFKKKYSKENRLKQINLLIKYRGK